MGYDQIPNSDKSSANDKQLVNGNAVAIDTLTNNTSDSHNVFSDSHDVSHTTVYNTTLTAEAEEARRKQEYRTFCEPFVLNGPVSENDRKSLALKAKALNLTEYETLEIENEVKERLCAPKRMSSIQEESLSEAINIIDSTRGNHKRALDILSSLKSKGFNNNETINFYYARELALTNPSAYLVRYERNSRKFFSYEDTFWAFFAYKKKSENSQAQDTIQTLAESTAYPEENAGLLLICDKLYDEISKPGTYNINLIRDGLQKYTGVSHNVEPLFETVEYILDNLDDSYVPLSNDERVNSYLSFFPIKKNIVQTKIRPDKPIPQAQVATPGETSVSYQSLGLSNQAISSLAPRKADNRETRTIPSHIPPKTNVVSSPANENTSAITDTKSSNTGKIIGLVGLILILWLGFKFFSGDGEKEQIAKNSEQIIATTENFTSEANSDAKVSTNKKNTNTNQSSINHATRSSKMSNETEQSMSHTSVSAPKESTANDESTIATLNISVNSVASSSTSSTPATANSEGSSEGKTAESTSTIPPAAPAPLTISQLIAKGKSLDGKSSTIASAINYYRQAADQGSVEAMFLLGKAYTFGNKATKDKVQAKIWLDKVIASGVDPWCDRAKVLERSCDL